MRLVTEIISVGCEVAIDLSCTNKVTHHMNTTANTTSNTIKMMIVLVMMLLSTAGFAQNTIEVPATVAASTTTVESNSSMNMVSWFMGTKQTTNENITKESNTRKQMMTNGIALTVC
ncbi:MAG: hypothetical protein IPP30_10705 [Flavobacterium sp.]|nr:hypothetical protein [Flavobacterium sp.]